MPQPTDDQLSARSGYTSEILGKLPPWLMRWGTTVVLLVVVSILAVSWLVKFPDVLNGRIVLVSNNPPVRLVSSQSGRLSILAENGKPVKFNDPIAFIQNDADLHSVLKLENWLSKISLQKTISDDIDQDLASFGEIGSLQDKYAEFYSFYQEHAHRQTTNPDKLREDSFNLEAQKLEKLLKVKGQQIALYDSELANARKSLVRFITLFDKGMVTQEQLDRKFTELSSIKKQIQQLQTSVVETEVSITRLQKERVRLKLDEETSAMTLLRNAKSAKHKLNLAIQIWKEKYLIVAPVAGRVSWSEYWSDHQHVVAGTEVFTIVPSDDEHITGKMHIAVTNSGKVTVGQKVIVKLDGFPYQEFGVIAGSVRDISTVPANNSYLVNVDLPSKLETSFVRNITFTQEMTGTAEIIAEDLRLLQRVYYQLFGSIST